MKVLQINCVYGKGSTGKITRDIHLTLLKNGIDSYVCYGRGELVEDKNIVCISSDLASRTRRIISMIDGMPYRFTKWTNLKVEKEIQKIQPDIVHIQCINGFVVDIYRLLDYLKKNNIPTIITLHAEFMYTGGCGYALDCNQWIDGCKKCVRLKAGVGVIGIDRVNKNYNLMNQAIENFGNLTIVGVSDWISRRALQSRVMRGCNVITIHNGIDTQNIFHYRVAKKIYTKYQIISNKKIILSVVPNLESDLKGGKLIMDIAYRMESYQFVVVGAREKVKNKPDNMVIIPYTESQIELAEIYSAADVFVIGSKMDNYPTVCIEANSCGTPVVGYDVGGVSETIFPGMGEVVPYGDILALEEKIKKWVDKKKVISRSILKDIEWRNSKERMAKDYISLYREVLKKSGSSV